MAQRMRLPNIIHNSPVPSLRTDRFVSNSPVPSRGTERLSNSHIPLTQSKVHTVSTTDTVKQSSSNNYVINKTYNQSSLVCCLYEDFGQELKRVTFIAKGRGRIDICIGNTTLSSINVDTQVFTDYSVKIDQIQERLVPQSEIVIIKAELPNPEEEETSSPVEEEEVEEEEETSSPVEVEEVKEEEETSSPVEELGLEIQLIQVRTI